MHVVKMFPWFITLRGCFTVVFYQKLKVWHFPVIGGISRSLAGISRSLAGISRSLAGISRSLVLQHFPNLVEECDFKENPWKSRILENCPNDQKPMTGKCRPMTGKCQGVDREMPANDREIPPMTGKCHPLLEMGDFEQVPWKIKGFAKHAMWLWQIHVLSWH